MIKSYFELEKYGSDIKTEVLAGITTFLACAYIIFVNPSVLAQAGLSFSGVLTATVMVSLISTVAMGFYANNPILIAPGMGLNAFFTFNIVLGMNLPVPTALGMVFWSGIIFLILSVFKIREKIVNAIPESIEKSIACGIGLFIAFIGLKNGLFITGHPVNLVALKKLNPETLTFIIGLAITIFFVVRKIKGGLLLGIFFSTIISIPLGRYWGDKILVDYNGFFATPDMSLFFSLDLVGSLKFALFPAIFSILFTNLFDSLSTFVGVSHASGLLDKNGKPLRMKRSLIVDAFSTILSGLFGTSPATSFIESSTGIQQGGRTGITSITAGILFLPFLFLSPLLSVIPILATAPALFLVGIFMMKPVVTIKWDELDEAIPAFVALIVIPLTFSITNGIIWGFLSWTFCKLVTGQFKKISPLLYLIDVFCIMMLSIGH